jgi:uncharacterized damage-inducible protein DinB
MIAEIPGAFPPLLHYTRWANEKVLRRLDELGSALPASTRRLMSHIVNAQSVWLQRIKGEDLIVGVWDEHELPRCRQLNQDTLDGLQAVLEGLPGKPDLGPDPGPAAKPAGDLLCLIVYKTTTGQLFESSIFDILLQTFNHGTYHRAQIAMDLRQRGIEPVNTDYIVFTRSNRP